MINGILFINSHPALNIYGKNFEVALSVFLYHTIKFQKLVFRQHISSPKTWSLTCCKKWTWRRDASKFGELILCVACSTKTLLSTRVKAFHIFPHTVASNVVFCQKYVLSEKDCLCPVMKIVHKYLMPQNFGNILFHLQYKNINIKHIWNTSFFTSNKTDRVPWS